MQIVCSWCGKYLGDKEPLGDFSITGTICGDCNKKAGGKTEESEAEVGEEFASGGGQDDKSER